MRRFFVDPENITGPHAVLSGAEARHLSTVLRLAPGAAVTLFDGSGSYYEALLTKVSPNRVEAKIVAITPYVEEIEDFQPLLHLGMGVLKGRKMDLVIQKTTELGIKSLHPFHSRYCAAREQAGGRLQRWRKIAREACKQCNRPQPPELHEVMDFQALLARSGDDAPDLKLIFWEEAGRQNSLQESLAAVDNIHSVLLLIGPEGGFSSEEVAAALGAGFQSVTLGGRILRAETAAIAAVAILQHALGNLV